MRRLLAALAVLTASAYALVTAYEVEPVRAEWSGIADGPGGVSQTVTCNFDSLRKVDLFVGEPGAGGGYAGAQAAPFDLEVRDEATGELVAYRRGVVPAGGHRWLRFAEPTTVGRFVKGKSYRFSFTRSEPGGINYYYRDDDPYPHGGISGDAGPDGRDLALRAYGAMDTISRNRLGVNPFHPWEEEWWGAGADWDGPRVWEERASGAGVGAVRFDAKWVWFTRDAAHPLSFDFSRRDEAYRSFRRIGAEPLGLLHTCDRRLGTHLATIGGVERRSIESPPRNLFEPVGSDSNYWARFVERTVQHYDSLSHAIGSDSIRYWQVWNEPNIIAEYWHRSNSGDYGRPGDSLTDFQMCSLYVRLCVVADSVLKNPAFGGNPANRVLAGSFADVEKERDGGEYREMVKGKNWLRWMYEIADRQYGGPCWDGVAFHYYPNPWHPILPYFVQYLEANADTLRAIMSANGDYGELWVTETGWPVAGGLTGAEQANALTEAFTTAMGSPTRPGGALDRCYWFCFRDTRTFRLGFTDTLMQELRPSYHAFGHLMSVLPGRRSTGRVRLGDERDGRLFIHEFEDPQTEQRLWVGWTNRRESFQPAESISVRLPALTDRLSLAELPYADREPKPARRAVGADGRFTLTLTNRPVFISEVGRAARPDLVVDSVWTVPGQVTVGRPCTLYVRFSNLGSRATRHSGSERNAHLRTGARFYAGDRLLGERDHSSAIGVGRAVTLGLPWTPEAVGPVLIRVAVNEDRAYVEHYTDGNAGYRRLVVLPDPAEDSGR